MLDSLCTQVNNFDTTKLQLNKIKNQTQVYEKLQNCFQFPRISTKVEDMDIWNRFEQSRADVLAWNDATTVWRRGVENQLHRRVKKHQNCSSGANVGFHASRECAYFKIKL